jgi:hypothetical protein
MAERTSEVKFSQQKNGLQDGTSGVSATLRYHLQDRNKAAQSRGPELGRAILYRELAPLDMMRRWYQFGSSAL